ncbi:MAG TPA: glycosyl hydrolase family 65 protein [Actinomycetota bacterium]|nr:glycosyl hydrolase family 65 protein [Actinomycetota bacterium]
MNGWVFTYEGFDPAEEGLREALCTLGNGRFATRGAAPESTAGDVHYPGTYAAGVYNRLTTSFDGREIENEDLVNLPNWLPLTFRIQGGEWFDAGSVELMAYRQELDLRAGTLTRHIRFRSGGWLESALIQRRFVSMDDPRVAGLETTIVAENWSGRLEVRSGIDGDVVNAGVPRYRALANRHLTHVEQAAVDDESVRMVVETNDSHIRIGLATRTRASVNGEQASAERALVDDPGWIGHRLSLDLARGDAATLSKVATLFTSRDPAVSDPGCEAATWVARADPFEVLHERHRRAWERTWERFDIGIAGNERTQLILRLHLFHLVQTVSRHTIDLDVGVPARGLHGEAYRGHVFWDELFIFPLLNYRLPVLTRSLLEYRHRRLPESRWAARSHGLRGAMFPWQSGSNGREETQRFHLNPRSGRWIRDHSRLQRHVNLAIAYNVWQHFQVTGDVHFLRYHGAELVIEAARLFASLASDNQQRGRYDIAGVLGPDEYHDAYPDRDVPGLDNNAYTNVMTAWLMCRALDLMDVLPGHLRAELRDQLGVTTEELIGWDDMSRRLFVPFHDGVISQFEGYADLEELDWNAYRDRYGDIARLDRVLEAEGDTPNRYKLSKQADVLMLFYLLSPPELTALFERLGYAFDPQVDMPRNVEYYLSRTAHGSTLSRVVHAWVLARLDRGRSWEHMATALESDVADVQGGTTREGIHLGAMAGTVDIVQRAYTGISVHDDCLWFDPALPTPLTHLDVELHYRGHRLRVQVTPERFRLATRPGMAGPIRVGFRDLLVEMRPGTELAWPLDRARL